jgi:hypothetical protein
LRIARDDCRKWKIGRDPNGIDENEPLDIGDNVRVVGPIVRNPDRAIAQPNKME